MKRPAEAYSGVFLLQVLRQDKQRYGKESFKAGFISIAGRTVELFREGQKIKGSHTNGPTCSHLRKIVAFQQNFIILLYKAKER